MVDQPRGFASEVTSMAREVGTEGKLGGRNSKSNERRQEKCIEAGASDYITNPLKIDQLLSLLRVWFYK